MLLENKYYTVVSVEKTDSLSAKFHLSLLPECTLYQGHFPGNPVCPGVCNMETIKECAMHLTGEELHYSSIKQCRLTNVASPSVCPSVDVLIKLVANEGGYSLQATIADDKRQYMELKGQLEIQNS